MGLNTRGLKTRQVSVDGMSFILGNIFQVGRVAAFAGSSEPQHCKFEITHGFWSLLPTPPPVLEQRLKMAFIGILNNLASWIKMQSSGWF